MGKQSFFPLLAGSLHWAMITKSELGTTEKGPRTDSRVRVSGVLRIMLSVEVKRLISRGKNQKRGNRPGSGEKFRKA